MPKVHNAITRSNWGDAIKRALGVTKSEGGIERFGETLTPIIDLWGPVDFAFLRGELRGVRGALVAAGGAGTFAGVTLVNPLGSGRLLTVTSARFAVPVLANVSMSQASSALMDASFATGISAFSLDVRQQGMLSEVKTGIPAVAPPIGNHISIMPAIANEVILAQELIGMTLRPGNGILIQTADDAATLFAAFQWRERVALLGELG